MIFKNLFKDKKLEKKVRKLEDKIDDINSTIGMEIEEEENQNPFSYYMLPGDRARRECILGDKLDTLYKHFKLQYINKECKTNIVRKLNKSKK